MKLTKEMIRGVPIEIEVDQSGIFSADFNEHTFSGRTRQELIDKLSEAVKKAKEQNPVPVTVLGLVPVALNAAGKPKLWSKDPFEPGAGVVQAQLRAKHERHYNTWLLQADSGQKFQVEGRQRGVIARRLNAKEVADYLALVSTHKAAEDALEAFVTAVRLDPEEALKEAGKPGQKAAKKA